jgi:hypothetical protein
VKAHTVYTRAVRGHDDAVRCAAAAPPPSGFSTSLPHCLKREHEVKPVGRILNKRGDAPMADQTSSAATDMDYPEHERTYAGFVAFTTWATIAIAALLVGMAIFLV